jgi:hypothetical protein
LVKGQSKAWHRLQYPLFKEVSSSCSNELVDSFDYSGSKDVKKPFGYPLIKVIQPQWALMKSFKGSLVSFPIDSDGDSLRLSYLRWHILLFL